MELGNMVFGNSRGEYPVPRDETFEEPWEKFVEAAGLHYRGYAEGDDAVSENDVFSVRSYDWDAECDCGADEKMEAWHASHKHAPECYQTELHERMNRYDIDSGYKVLDEAAFGGDRSPFGGMNVEVEHPMPGVTTMIASPREDDAMEQWREAHDARNRFQRQLFSELGKKYGVDPKFGAMVHCTCGHDASAEAYWVEIGGHSNACRFVQPNFLFKPTDFRLNWYKYPFRDSYMSQPLTGEEWARMMDSCIASLVPKN